ncbi:MAG: GTP-binding protein [Candidatus Hodarchaeales archaeon]
MIWAENWAIFAEGEQIQWTFGSMTSETALLTTRLARGLNDLGKEIFHETVASLRVRDINRKPTRSYDILIVNFGENFFFLAADPISTAKMLRVTHAVDGIPGNIADLLHGVLMGQALQTYGDLWSAAASEQQCAKIDQIYDDAFQEMGVKEDSGISAKDGTCSFSGLEIPELLLLHCYLQQRFEKEVQPTVRKPWSCVIGKGGLPVYLVHNILRADVEQQLAFLFSAVAGYSLDLFGAIPEALVFSREGLTSINLFVGENTIFAACNPFSLFQDEKFLANFSRLTEPIKSDIIGPTEEFLSKYIGQLYAERLREESFQDLIETLKRVDTDFSTSQAPLEELKLTKETTTIEEVALELRARDEVAVARSPMSIPQGTQIKLIIVGEPEVGKSTIAEFMAGETFAPEYLLDAGAQFFDIEVRIGHNSIPARIWDLSGKQKMEFIHDDFFTEASGAFIVFDVTRPSSFDMVEPWITEIWNKNGRGPIPIVLLGNKVDSRGSNHFDTVADEDAFSLAVKLEKRCLKEYGFRVSFFLVSAKTGQNLTLALHLLSLRSLIHHLGLKSIHEIM